MKQYLNYFKFLGITLFLTFIIFEIIVIGILKYPKDTFHSSYQSLIQDKFRILEETNEPKIIIISGSSSAFGLDQKMLESKTGYKVANLGLHAGFGHLFHSELAKANINSGDIVLLGYEYNWIDGFNYINMDLAMSAIDSDIKMYKYIPRDKWVDCIGNLFHFAEKKNTYAGASGIYSRDAFDSVSGQLTMERDCSLEYQKENFEKVDISNVTISEDAVCYLKEFKEYIEKRGGMSTL